MFRIGISETLITVKDHSQWHDHLRSLGVNPTDVNFFSYNAFPNKSYGKFLVYEKEWIDSGLQGGNQTFDLWINDQYTSIRFSGLEVVGTCFVMAPNQIAQQDGSRMLIVELELTQTKYHDSNRLYENYETFPDLRNAYENGTMLYLNQPFVNAYNIYNKYVLPDVSIVDYLAYIAETNFLTCYLSPTGTKPKLTSTLFNYEAIPPQVNLIYNKIAISTNPQDIHVVLQSTETCTPEFSKSEGDSLNFNETYFYESSVNTNTQRQEIITFIPYIRYDHTIAFTNPSVGSQQVDAASTFIVPYARNRLQRNVHLIYQGLVPGELAADVQSIIYSYEGNSIGFRTHLRTIPWGYDNPILAIREVACKDSIYIAELKTHLLEGTATADIYRLTVEPTKVIDKDVMVLDKLNLFTNYRSGTRCYVYRECESCAYVIIQGPCPPKTPVTSG